MANYFQKHNLSERSVFLPLMLSLIVDMLGYSLTLPLLPTIVQAFDGTDFMVGIIISANAFTALIFGPIWGKLSDKHGRKKILLISQVGTFVAFLLLALSNSIPMILFARLLDGTFGGQYPVIHAIVSDITNPDNRAEKISQIMVSVSLATMIGPLLGGVLGEINWRFPPLITAILSLISIWLTLKILVETMPKSRRDEIKKLKESTENLQSKSNIFSATVKLRLLQLFAIYVLFTMFTSSMALVLDARYQQGPAAIGIILFIVFILLMVFGVVLMKPLRIKLGDSLLALVAVGSCIIAWSIFTISINLWIFFIFLFFLIFFQAILRPLLRANLTKAVDENQQGEISGWSTTVQSIAQTIIPLLSTGFLELGQIQFFAVNFESYTLIGICSIAFAIILGVILIQDVWKNPETFKRVKN